MRYANPILVLITWLLLPCAALAAPSITLSKGIGPPTSEILVFGHGFEPHCLVDIYFDRKHNASVLTNNEGEFQHALIQAPREAKPGEHWITALERNNDKGDQKPFVVNTNWKQVNFGPGHDGLNPYENVLGPSNVGNLRPAWVYNTTIDGWTAGPAVADGIVYAGSYGGNLYAVDALTGKLRWENPYTAGGITYPTVGDGLVYVGADYEVNALNQKTGRLVWKFHADTNGCCLSPPTVVDNRVYVVLDQVYALDSRRGALVWKYPLDGTGQAVANGVVYVGRDATFNNVVALDAKTGALLWTVTVDGGAYVSPTISNGVLYVPTASGMIFALDPRTGQPFWKFTTDNTTGSPSPAVIADGKVFFSSLDNVAYALDATTGGLLWSYSAEKSGLNNAGAAFANGVAYFGLGNDLIAFEPETGQVLWRNAIAGNVWSPPAVANGVVYASVPDVNGILYAFDLGKGANARRLEVDKRPDFEALRPDPTLQPVNSK